MPAKERPIAVSVSLGTTSSSTPGRYSPIRVCTRFASGKSSSAVAISTVSSTPERVGPRDSPGSSGATSASSEQPATAMANRTRE